MKVTCYFLKWHQGLTIWLFLQAKKPSTLRFKSLGSNNGVDVFFFLFKKKKFFILCFLFFLFKIYFLLPGRCSINGCPLLWVWSILSE